MTYEPNQERYKLYRLRGDQLQIVATCATKEAVGTALVTLGHEGEWLGCSLGVLDKPDPSSPGTWLASPWGGTA